ncbi:flagellar type III secretion system pore protein FliP [Aminipila butyrica]|uniref:Flagellar biosynthetic protein FliP n=1 Tax=Aminipila butyrica TaxID=433296 RepID=A0A858BR91_9FIRM|nr:flagellar type III secretion system pore protein FliP [Aminipila butyrica]QIB68383.1 flagellar type III secretion system pore protein FliP [Aminipila butyrica]
MTDSILSINGTGMQTLEILVLLTLIALLPSILIMMTSFTRIVIVLSLLRNAMGLQQTPPNTVIIGIALFLSLFIMQPVITDINEQAYQPYKADQITQEQAIDTASVPLKEFMLKQTKVESLNVFLNFAGLDRPENLTDVPMHVVIPAFMTSELSRAFLMGFLLYIPFLVIDIIVASVLMSMGMVMLPPSMISMPFKLLLFVVVNGWELLFTTLVSSFN